MTVGRRTDGDVRYDRSPGLGLGPGLGLTGGSASCVLKDFKTKVARRLAKKAERKIKEEPGVLKRIMAEEAAKA
jgi:hypothetical protein